MHITIINPAEDSPIYHSMQFVKAWGYEPIAMVACAAIATVAAFVPKHWTVDLIDETVTPIVWERVAPIVAITGTTVQTIRMRALAEQARASGRLVVIGGSYASLNPSEVAPWCDILCVGEMEEVAETVFRDIEAGCWKPRYEGNRPDLSQSPIPRWDLYPNHKALIGVVQTSRGCPFECDFCDVIAYLGRKQRHKSVAQVIAELDQLYRLGYRSVFLADDNLTVYRRRAIALLTALKDWNAAHEGARVTFNTQVSVDAARDESLLALLAEAGVSDVFVGIETPNEESLISARKRQNVGVDLVGVLEAFVRHGIAVNCGIIVGFDADGPDIFERQARFIAQLPVPFVSISPLSAPSQTPLYARLEREGRLIAEGAATPLDPFATNIVPLGMSRAQLMQGVRDLILTVYDIDAFMGRVHRFISLWGGDAAPVPLVEPQANVFSPFAAEMLARISKLGPREHAAMQQVIDAVEVRPWLFAQVMGFIGRYAQIRFLFERAFAAGTHPDGGILSAGTAYPVRAA